MTLYTELKRRNVFRAVAAYAALAWLIAQAAEIAVPAFGFGDAALRTVLVVLAIGFVPVVGLSWAFEWTPGGFVRERDAEHDGEPARSANRRLDGLIVAALALGVAYFAFDKFVLDPARDAERIAAATEAARSEALVESFGERSIAVLPFVNMSADPEQEYFADGMAEEVLNLLARIPELRLISRSSAFTFKNSEKKIAEIAAELDVSYVLEGSVRRAGERIRVTAQLIDARTDAHLWSQTWDRPFGDVFAIQDEIAAEVAENLELRLLGGAPTARRVDADAYALYLQGRYLVERFDYDALEPAVEAFQEALAIDPGYGKAWHGLAWAYYRVVDHLRRASHAAGWMTADEARAQLGATLDRGLAIVPGEPGLLGLKAWVLWNHEPRDYEAAARLYERTLALDPGNADALAGAGSLAWTLGDQALGARLIETALRRDPLCNWCTVRLVWAYTGLGRLDEAESALRRLKARVAVFPWSVEFDLLFAQERYEDAIALAERKGASPPELLAMRAEAWRRQGRVEAVRAAVTELEATGADNLALEIAELHRWLGDMDAAFDWLERAAAQDCGRLRRSFNHNPGSFEGFTDEPRWDASAQRCDLPAEPEPPSMPRFVVPDAVWERASSSRPGPDA